VSLYDFDEMPTEEKNLSPFSGTRHDFVHDREYCEYGTSWNPCRLIKFIRKSTTLEIEFIIIVCYLQIEIVHEPPSIKPSISITTPKGICTQQDLRSVSF
jgi:hypothetical protein